MKPLITAQTIRALAETAQKTLVVSKDSIITPAARDEAKDLGITIEQTPGVGQQAAGETGCLSRTPITDDRPLNGLVQIIVQEVIRQLSLKETGVILDQSGLMQAKSERLAFAPAPSEPLLKKKALFTRKEQGSDVGLMALETAEIFYTPQSTELICLIEGVLKISIDGREYAAEPQDAVSLPAGKKVALSAKNKAVWFYVRNN